MKIENTTAQMRKGVLEFCILSLISGGDLYTSEILEALKKGKMLVVEGTVYLWTSAEILFHHQRGGGISY